MPKIAIGQFTATANPLDNLLTCRAIIEQAASVGKARVIFLPEASDFLGGCPASSDISAFLQGLQQCARDFECWVMAGVHILDRTCLDSLSQETAKMFNTHVAIDPTGQIVQSYHKIHLFDHAPSGLKESDRIHRGQELMQPVDLGDGMHCGLQVCYDMRFGELARMHLEMGANILAFPSAFTVATGRLHWECLLRARAIETQSFVVGAAQVGRHGNNRESWGESLIVDPDGRVLVRLPSFDTVGDSQSHFDVGFADLDMSLVRDVRTRIPIALHRRERLWHRVEN
eukprot:Partr_v1_DN24263_c0_g1_i1_m36805 putative nitrilase